MKYALLILFLLTIPVSAKQEIVSIQKQPPPPPPQGLMECMAQMQALAESGHAEIPSAGKPVRCTLGERTTPLVPRD